MLHRDEDLALRIEALERRADNLEDAELNRIHNKQAELEKFVLERLE